MKKQKRVFLGITIPLELRKRAKLAAVAECRSMSAFVEVALQEALAVREKGKK